MSPRDRSQAQPRDARPERIQGGEKPLLQGHLKKKRFISRPVVEASAHVDVPTAADEPPTAKSRGRATKSPENIATRRHLEGSDQGPS